MFLTKNIHLCEIHNFHLTLKIKYATIEPWII